MLVKSEAFFDAEERKNGFWKVLRFFTFTSASKIPSKQKTVFRKKVQSHFVSNTVCVCIMCMCDLRTCYEIIYEKKPDYDYLRSLFVQQVYPAVILSSYYNMCADLMATVDRSWTWALILSISIRIHTSRSFGRSFVVWIVSICSICAHQTRELITPVILIINANILNDIND